MKYEELLEKPEYEFMNNEDIKKRLIYLVLGGSISYGTSTPESDTDIRGFMLNPVKEIIGTTSDFEQVVDTDTDTVIYSLQKIFKLFSECNPNTLEMLGVNPEHVIHMTRFGKRVHSIKDFFLSKRAIMSYGGYANGQFSRLQHALLSNGSAEDKKLMMAKTALEHSLSCFVYEHSKYDLSYKFSEVENDETGDKELALSMSVTDVPLRHVKQSLAIITNVYNDYNKVNKEFSKKKIEDRLSKHMMHTCRLLTSGADLIAERKIKTYRDGEEHNLLMSIRRGDYLTPDKNNVIPEFWEVVHDLQEKFDYAVKHTTLPDKYNKDIVEGTLIEIQRDYINGNT